LKIPFNIPYISGQELFYLKTALQSGHYSSEGLFIDRCKDWFKTNYAVSSVLLTPSCSSALELAAMMLNVGPGDEVILPSFTHISTANAFALRGATLIFAEIEPQTMTICVNDVRKKMSPRTKVIVAVHYGGYPAGVRELRKLCDENGVFLIEDAAHSIGARVDHAYQGTIGHMGCLSFHETKNIHCGEGGALLINDPAFIETAEIIFEKGTNRSAYLRGEVSEYEWLRPGSSFAMSNIAAAVLLAQLQETDNVNYQRTELWKYYYQCFSEIPDREKYFRMPPMPENIDHFNAHIFFLQANSPALAKQIADSCAKAEIPVQFHFPPLHESPYGKKYRGDCPLTTYESRCLIRFPMFVGLNKTHIDRIASILEKTIKKFDNKKEV